MNEIAKNTVVAARVAVTPSTVERKATPQAPKAPAGAVQAQAKAEAADKVEAPTASNSRVATESSAVEPLSPTGPTRVTAYSDSSSGRYVIQVREAESNEVINQYPPKELLRFYAAAREALEQAVERSAKAKDVSA